MLNRMSAEICFCNRDQMNAAASELIELDFEVRELDWIDDEIPAVWIVADTHTALDPTNFFLWVSTVVDPFDGFVVEAWPSAWPSKERCNRVRLVAGNRQRGGRNMLQRMSAEITFLNTDGPGPVIQKLLEIDYDFEVFKWDWHDGTKPDTTVTVRAITELDALAFFDHVQAIVGPLGGDVIAADLVSWPPPGSCRPANLRRRRA